MPQEEATQVPGATDAGTSKANRNRSNAARAVPLKRTRFWLICLFFLVWTLAIGGRLFWLQVVRHKELSIAPRSSNSGHLM